jgi:hypothetical protein
MRRTKPTTIFADLHRLKFLQCPRKVRRGLNLSALERIAFEAGDTYAAGHNQQERWPSSVIDALRMSGGRHLEKRLDEAKDA